MRNKVVGILERHDSLVRSLADAHEAIKRLESTNKAVAAQLDQLRNALSKWKAYFQTEEKGPLTDSEQAGEDFTDAWFQMEEALK